MTSGGDIEVFVSLGAFQDEDAGLLERGVRAALRDAGVDAAEISVTLLDDTGIRGLNRDYLDHDRPTDVIAFALDAPGGVIGDVYLGVEQARRQAVEWGVPSREELLRLAVHGTLHVLGHDHPAGPDRAQSEMFTLQERLVAQVLTHR